MPGRAFTYDCQNCQHREVGVPIAPTEISLPRNRTAMVLQPSCRTHYCGQTIDFSFCISWQNNKRRATQFLCSVECKRVVKSVNV